MKHGGYWEYGMQEYTAFLYPIRDPLERVVLTFNYHHPDNRHQEATCQQMQNWEARLKKWGRKRQKLIWQLDSFIIL